MKKYIIIGLLVFAGFLGFVGWSGTAKELLEARKDIRELQLRLANASEKVDTFWIHDSIPVYRTKVVEVDRTDYKKELADRALIKELGLKVSQLESENRLLLSTRDTVVLEAVETSLHGQDSILTYRDKWAYFSYDTTRRVLDWEVRDSLSAFVAREYRHRFLWWKWGVKGYEVYVVSHNPRCRVEYNKYIRLR